MRLQSINDVGTDDFKSLILDFVDMKRNHDIVADELKRISDMFKDTPDTLIERNEPYLVNFAGRSFCFKIDRRSRTTTDSKLLANECQKRGIDTEPFKKSAEVQSFTAVENRLFD